MKIEKYYSYTDGEATRIEWDDSRDSRDAWPMVLKEIGQHLRFSDYVIHDQRTDKETRAVNVYGDAAKMFAHMPRLIIHGAWRLDIFRSWMLLSGADEYGTVSYELYGVVDACVVCKEEILSDEGHFIHVTTGMPDEYICEACCEIKWRPS
jgi:hypothetical protein